MPLTNFPQGATSFGVPLLGGATIPTTTGKYIFVNSVTGGTGAGRGESPEAPLATLAQGFSAATASKGDVIVLMPGHAETVATASGIDMNKAGVSVVGLGVGANRPTFTLSATASTILISAASILWQNCIVTSSIDELVTCVSVTAASVILDAIDYVDGSAVQTISFLLTSAAADDLVVRNCNHTQGTAPATAGSWIRLIGTDRARIVNNNFNITQQNGATSCVIGSDTTAPLNIVISGNNIIQLGGTTIASAILLVASTSGIVSYNNVGSTATANLGSIAIASCYGAQNFSTNVVNKNGILDPVADS